MSIASRVSLPEVFAWRLSHGFEYAERADDASHVCELMELGFGPVVFRRPGPLRTNPIRPETSEGVANLFILGDLIGPDRNCNALLQAKETQTRRHNA